MGLHEIEKEQYGFILLWERLEKKKTIIEIISLVNRMPLNVIEKRS